MEMDTKLCDECNSNPANVHLTQIVQNEVIVQHLCEECAKHRGISIVIEDGHLSMPQTAKKQKKGQKNNERIKKERLESHPHMGTRHRFK